MRFLSYIIGLSLCAYGVFRAAILLREVHPDALIAMAISSAELPLALLLFVVGVLFLVTPRNGAGAESGADPRIPAMRQDIEALKAELGKRERAAPHPATATEDELQALRGQIAALSGRLDDQEEQPPATPPPVQELESEDEPEYEPEPEPEPPAPAKGMTRNLSAFERLLLNAMIAMIGVDGALEESEIARACEAFADVTGHPIDPGSVRALARMMAEGDARIEELLSRATADLDADQRREIIEGAYIVAVADDELHPDEMAAMHRIGEALGLSLGEIHRIIDACIQNH